MDDPFFVEESVGNDEALNENTDLLVEGGRKGKLIAPGYA